MDIRVISTFLAVFLLNSSIFGQKGVVTVLSHKESKFVNINCKKTNTCDLKQVEYLVEDYSVGIENSYNYGTRFFARYQTNTVENLENYVFVQFVKGCLFSSKVEDGKVDISQDVAYPRESGSVMFKFPDWTIDSYNFDPVYSAAAGRSRFYYYIWNTVPGSFDTDTKKQYYREKPKIPQLYTVDHPGSAFYINRKAHNISLEFKTCIYRYQDVPASVSYDDINFAKPLGCYSWRSSFVYNHKTSRFESPSSISKACR